MAIKTEKFGVVVNTQVEGIDVGDMPDFVDAFFSYAFSIDLDRELTDEELAELTDEFPDIVHQAAWETVA